MSPVRRLDSAHALIRWHLIRHHLWLNVGIAQVIVAISYVFILGTDGLKSYALLSSALLSFNMISTFYHFIRARDHLNAIRGVLWEETNVAYQYVLTNPGHSERHPDFFRRTMYSYIFSPRARTEAHSMLRMIQAFQRG